MHVCAASVCQLVSAIWRRIEPTTVAIRVQMIWPDDNKWNLIQIDSADPRSRKAECVPAPSSFRIRSGMHANSDYVVYATAHTCSSTAQSRLCRCNVQWVCHATSNACWSGLQVVSIRINTRSTYAQDPVHVRGH